MALIDSIIHYWKLDETTGSTATDATGNQNGTYIGDLPTAVAGVISNAQDFDGTGDAITVTGVAGTGNNYSFSFWYDGLAAPNNNYMFDSATGRLLITMGITADTSGNIGYYDGTWRSFGVVVTSGAYKHYVITLSSSTSKGKLYINSVLQGTEPTYTNTTFSGNIHIGSNNTRNSSFIDGKLDEFGIWEKVLSQAEVNELYNSGNGLAYPFTAAAPTGNSQMMGANF